MFETYKNRHNPLVTIHRDTCGQLRKHAGVHKHRQGQYKTHSSLAIALDYAKSTGLPVIPCSFCRPSEVQGDPS